MPRSFRAKIKFSCRFFPYFTLLIFHFSRFLLHLACIFFFSILFALFIRDFNIVSRFFSHVWMAKWKYSFCKNENERFTHNSHELIIKWRVPRPELLDYKFKRDAQPYRILVGALFKENIFINLSTAVQVFTLSSLASYFLERTV